MSQLDFYFPFFMFFYSAVMLFMIDRPQFQRVQAQLSERSVLPVRAAAHPGFLWLMAGLSGLWCLQNLWLGH